MKRVYGKIRKYLVNMQVNLLIAYKYIRSLSYYYYNEIICSFINLLLIDYLENTVSLVT